MRSQTKGGLMTIDHYQTPSTPELPRKTMRTRSHS
jgi:hypothetical protein